MFQALARYWEHCGTYIYVCVYIYIYIYVGVYIYVYSMQTRRNIAFNLYNCLIIVT